jgi:hypothetical protein
MTESTQEPSDKMTDVEPQPHRVRLPGFLIDEKIGLGDLIKHATYASGVRPCSGCERRAAALNRWIVFSP